MAIKSLEFNRPNSRDIVIFFNSSLLHMFVRFYRRVDEIAVKRYRIDRKFYFCDPCKLQQNRFLLFHFRKLCM